MYVWVLGRKLRNRRAHIDNGNTVALDDAAIDADLAELMDGYEPEELDMPELEEGCDESDQVVDINADELDLVNSLHDLLYDDQGSLETSDEENESTGSDSEANGEGGSEGDSEEVDLGSSSAIIERHMNFDDLDDSFPWRPFYEPYYDGNEWGVVSIST